MRRREAGRGALLSCRPNEPKVNGNLIAACGVVMLFAVQVEATPQAAQSNVVSQGAHSPGTEGAQDTDQEATRP